MELSLTETLSGEEAEFDGYMYKDGRRVLSRIKRDVVMVIMAPRGRAVIFSPSNLVFDVYALEAEAVRAFMEQHRNDR